MTCKGDHRCADLGGAPLPGVVYQRRYPRAKVARWTLNRYFLPDD